VIGSCSRVYFQIHIIKDERLETLHKKKKNESRRTHKYNRRKTEYEGTLRFGFDKEMAKTFEKFIG
jgi:hypothetical protein